MVAPIEHVDRGQEATLQKSPENRSGRNLTLTLTATAIALTRPAVGIRFGAVERLGKPLTSWLDHLDLDLGFLGYL
jgi:hypothetical protein